MKPYGLQPKSSNNMIDADKVSYPIANAFGRKISKKYARRKAKEFVKKFMSKNVDKNSASSCAAELDEI
jgi:hypothetical protein